MSSEEESEQTPGLAEIQRHRDPVGDESDEEVMRDVGPKGAIADNMIDSIVELLVTNHFHVPGYGVQPQVGTSGVEAHQPVGLHQWIVP